MKGFIKLEKKYGIKVVEDEIYNPQCYYNLEEKHDCGVISNKEWNKINDEVTPKLFWQHYMN